MALLEVRSVMNVIFWDHKARNPLKFELHSNNLHLAERLMIQGGWTLSIVSKKRGQPGIALDYYRIVISHRTKTQPKFRRDL